MKRMQRLTLLSLAVAASGLASAQPGDVARGEEIAKTVCAACHAADGNSGIAMYPRLAAQNADYIIQETHLIKDMKRVTGAAPAMAADPKVAALTEQDIRDVAAFFAKQYPKPGEANPKENPELGARIFRGGLANKKLPACMSCHGPNGAGMPGGSTAKDGIVAYPRLGGQHKSYIVDQLKAYQGGQRNHPIMVDIAKRMSAEEMDAVGNFIQGLH